MDLPLVHQQAAGTLRVTVEDVPVLIGAHMHPVEIDLPILGDAVGILQVERARADGFYLRAKQLNARLIAVLHKVVMVGLPILGGDLDALGKKQGETYDE